MAHEELNMSPKNRELYNKMPAGVRKDLITEYFAAKKIGGSALENAIGMIRAHEGD